MFKKILSLSLFIGTAFLVVPQFPAQAADIPSTVCSGVTFSRMLKLGSVGQDVKCLQTILNKDAATQVAVSGTGSPGNESTYYGVRTQNAVKKFQEKYYSEILASARLSRGTGTVGIATTAKLNAIKNASIVQASTPTAPAPTQIQTPQIQPEVTPTSAIAKANPGVVAITVTKQVPEYQVTYTDPFGNGLFQVPTYTPTGRTTTQTLGAGSGFIITQDGYLLTNNHVIVDPQATYTITMTSGASQTAQVIYQASQTDVAILKMSGSGYPIVTMGNSDNLQLGQSVVAIGNALGQFSNTVSVGIVSGLHRTIQASEPQGRTETLQDVIQTDAAINPGNSGGPLINLNGEVVGINVATVQGSSNISFSLPITSIKTIVNSVLGRQI
jgi:S1-C subfamily serine protease